MMWIDGSGIETMMMSGGMVETMWRNGHIIWQGIRSCFGGGLWLDDKPWLDDDAWKNE